MEMKVNMLDYIIERTNRYIDSMPKKERKQYGQFFTSKETARFMAGLYTIPENLSKVRILDAGAGSGILSCALLERLEQISFFLQANTMNCKRLLLRKLRLVLHLIQNVSMLVIQSRRI